MIPTNAAFMRQVLRTLNIYNGLPPEAQPDAKMQKELEEYELVGGAILSAFRVNPERWFKLLSKPKTLADTLIIASHSVLVIGDVVQNKCQ